MNATARCVYANLAQRVNYHQAKRWARYFRERAYSTLFRTDAACMHLVASMFEFRAAEWIDYGPNYISCGLEDSRLTATPKLSKLGDSASKGIRQSSPQAPETSSC